jgi:hypothetical protein
LQPGGPPKGAVVHVQPAEAQFGYVPFPEVQVPEKMWNVRKRKDARSSSFFLILEYLY